MANFRTFCGPYKKGAMTDKTPCLSRAATPPPERTDQGRHPFPPPLATVNHRHRVESAADRQSASSWAEGWIIPDTDEGRAAEADVMRVKPRLAGAMVTVSHNQPYVAGPTPSFGGSCAQDFLPAGGSLASGRSPLVATATS